jgi:hypothetical protein
MVRSSIGLRRVGRCGDFLPAVEAFVQSLVFHFYYLPIMLTLPLSTGWPLYVKLKNGPELVNPSFVARISSALALLTLVSYVTLLMGVANFYDSVRAD